MYSLAPLSAFSLPFSLRHSLSLSLSLFLSLSLSLSLSIVDIALAGEQTIVAV